MAAPNYDLLNQVQDWLSNPNSPLVKQVQSEMAQYENQKGMTPDKYNQIAATKLMEKVQQQFGGQIPDRKAAEDYDYGRRAQQLQQDPQFKGLPEDAMTTVRGDGSGKTPYANAYGALDALRQYLPKQPPPTPASLPTSGGNGTPGAAASKPAPIQMKPGASDDEKLNETQLALLQGLAQTANGTKNTPQTFDEYDSPDLQRPFPPPEDSSFLQQVMGDRADEQPAIQDALKAALLKQQKGGK